MQEIKAKETEKKQPGMMERFKDRFKYDIKKMEVISGKYDINTKVTLHYEALMKAFVYYAVTEKTQGSKEIMGWLAGKIGGDQIEIVDAYIGNCKSSMAYTELDAVETIKMKKLAKERGLCLVGQFHSHPSFSTNPSGEDTDTMRTLVQFGMKKPIMIIVNSEGFWLGTYEKHGMKKLDFVIPPKTDNKLDINLGYINGEYHAPMFNDYYSGYGYPVAAMLNDEKTVMAFYGMIGNYFILGIDLFVPFLKLKRYVDWGT